MCFAATIGPLHDPVTWYGLCWDASYTAGLPKQRKDGLDWYEFLCFGSPTALFAFQHNLFHTMCKGPIHRLTSVLTDFLFRVILVLQEKLGDKGQAVKR